jgi:hypothetical protein
MTITFTDGQKYDIRNFFIYTPLFIILFSTFAWNYSASYFDNYSNKDIDNPYLIRNILTGFSSGIASFIMGYFIYVAEYRKFHISKNNIVDILYYFVASFFTGFMWQIEADVSSTIALQKYEYEESPIVSQYTFADVLCTLIMMTFFHTTIFHFTSKFLCQAIWSRVLVSLQIGFSAFGLYLSKYFDYHDIIINSLLSSCFALVFAYIPVIYWLIDTINKNKKRENESVITNLYGVPFLYN